MQVHGKEIDTSKLGNAMTYITAEATKRFHVIDRAMFALSPYLTDDEAWKIVTELERMATGTVDGNFTDRDAFNWLAYQLTPARYEALQMMWTLDNQNNITKLYAPEQLRPAWIHKITMTEATPEELVKNPDNYVRIQTTRDEFQ